MNKRITRRSTITAAVAGTTLILGATAPLDSAEAHRARPVVVQPVARRPVIHLHVGWHRTASSFVLGEVTWFFHRDLEVFFGGAALTVELEDVAPHGYLFFNPPSGETFRSVAAFKLYCERHPGTPRVLTLVKI